MKKPLGMMKLLAGDLFAAIQGRAHLKGF